MAVIDSYYSTSAFRPGPSALLTYFDAFVGERSRMNDLARQARLRQLDPAALNDRMDSIQKTIAMLQGEKARIAREGLEGRQNAALEYTKSVGNILAGEAGKDAAIVAAKINARTDLLQTAESEATRRMQLVDPGPEAAATIEAGFSRLVDGGASAARDVLDLAYRDAGAEPGSAKAMGVNALAYKRAARLQQEAMQKGDEKVAASMGLLMEEARQRQGLGPGENFDALLSEYAGQGWEDFKKKADWATRGGIGGGSREMLKQTTPFLRALGVGAGPTPEEKDVIKGLDKQIDDLNDQLRGLDDEAAKMRDPAAINAALFGSGTRNYLLDNPFARSHKGQGFVNAVALLPRDDVKIRVKELDNYRTLGAAIRDMEDPGSDVGGWSRLNPQFNLIPDRGTQIVSILGDYITDALAVKEEGGDPTVFLDEAMRILNTMPGSQRQLAQPVVSRLMDAYKMMTPREVQGQGGWAYKQETDGTITIINAPAGKEGVIGTVLTPDGAKAAAYQAITRQIGPHSGNKSGVTPSTALQEALGLANQVMGDVYTSDVVAAKVREAGNDPRKLDAVSDWLKGLEVKDEWTTSVARAIDTAIDRADMPSLMRDMANVQAAADEKKFGGPMSQPGDMTKQQVEQVQDAVDLAVGQDMRPPPAVSAPAQGAYGAPVTATGRPVPGAPDVAASPLGDAVRGVPATASAALPMPEAPATKQLRSHGVGGELIPGTDAPGQRAMLGVTTGAEVERKDYDEMPAPAADDYATVASRVKQLENLALGYQRAYRTDPSLRSRYQTALDELRAEQSKLAAMSPPAP